MFNFLKKLFIKEKPAEKNEIVARFIAEKSKYKREKKCLTHSAFIPPKNSKEISVCCILDIIKSPQKIWDIAVKYVSSKILGRGDLSVEKIKEIKSDSKSLSVLINGSPHKRHANIKGFPAPSERSKVKAIAISLSDISTLVLRNSE
ncbi:MAG: hypothetical protein ABIE74_07435 [Pseudomonadota bacterium]